VTGNRGVRSAGLMLEIALCVSAVAAEVPMRLEN
jgi:hypothetical protein